MACILKLTTLAPDIIEAILNGEEPVGLSLTKLTRSPALDPPVHDVCAAGQPADEVAAPRRWGPDMGRAPL